MVKPKVFKMKVPPKDLAFSIAWFISCFLTNVTRLRYDLKLVESHPVNMESEPEIQRLMFNWRSENGTAGCYMQFTKKGNVRIHQWFGTDPVLKQQLENVWNGCRQQLEKAWRTVQKVRRIN